MSVGPAVLCSLYCGECDSSCPLENSLYIGNVVSAVLWRLCCREYIFSYYLVSLLLFQLSFGIFVVWSVVPAVLWSICCRLCCCSCPLRSLLQGVLFHLSFGVFVAGSVVLAVFLSIVGSIFPAILWCIYCREYCFHLCVGIFVVGIVVPAVPWKICCRECCSSCPLVSLL